jgi:hypothetical protein
MFCTRCGTAAPEAAGFCRSCGLGLRLQALVTPNLQLAGKGNSRIKWRVFVGLFVCCCVGLFALCLHLSLSSMPNSFNEESARADAESAKAKARVDDALKNAPRLLAAAKQESSHPGIIYRYACQIPSKSPLVKDASKEIARADQISDRVVMRELRREAARTLQNGYYREGNKVDVRVIEGKKPVLELQYILFDETTASVHSDTLAQTLLPMGFYGVNYTDGYDHSSSWRWKAQDVERLEFGKIHQICAEVRTGRKSPDEINATVTNPK